MPKKEIVCIAVVVGGWDLLFSEPNLFDVTIYEERYTLSTIETGSDSEDQVL